MGIGNKASGEVGRMPGEAVGHVQRPPWVVAARRVQHADSRLGPAGQLQRVVHVHGHLALGNAHAAADRDYVPSPSAAMVAPLASVTACKQTRDRLYLSN